MLRYLSQPRAITYNTSSHPEVFYEKVLLKVSQNSQENSYAGDSFSCNFDKKKLWHRWYPVNFRKLFWCQNTKSKCMQMYSKRMYICFLYYKSNLLIEEKKYLLQMLQLFYDMLKIKKVITRILSIGHLIRFIWIIVLAFQVWQEMFVLGLGSHLS